MEMNGGTGRAVDTPVYTTRNSAHHPGGLFYGAAALEAKRPKSNVMHSGVLGAGVRSFAPSSDVELTHILADNCAMQLMRRPAIR
jgi:3-isopropylmalate dehydrogenase